jgi:hypothetical protein
MLLLILELLDAKCSRSFVSNRILILLQVLLQEGAKTHDDQELTLAQITQSSFSNSQDSLVPSCSI